MEAWSQGVSAGTVSPLGSLEFSRAGTEFWWEGGVESSTGCGCELLATVLVFVQVFMDQG